MRVLTCVFAVVVAAAPVAAQTDITTHIVTNTTWGVGGSPYTIHGSIWVDSSSTLTIDPGVVVKFSAAAALEAQEGSAIVANGTPSAMILFTSASDTPVSGDWNFMGAESSPGSEFSHCVFEYATYNLTISRSTATVSFCTMRYAYTDGINCYKASPTITNCDIVDNARGIKISGPDASPVINYCNLYDNGENLMVTGYEELPLVTINAENNWWGTDIEEEIGWTIDVHPNAVGFVEVDFDPWLHEVPVEEVTWGRVKAMFAR